MAHIDAAVRRATTISREKVSIALLTLGATATVIWSVFLAYTAVALIARML